MYIPCKFSYGFKLVLLSTVFVCVQRRGNCGLDNVHACKGTVSCWINAKGSLLFSVNVRNKRYGLYELTR